MYMHTYVPCCNYIRICVDWYVCTVTMYVRTSVNCSVCHTIGERVNTLVDLIQAILYVLMLTVVYVSYNR